MAKGMMELVQGLPDKPNSRTENDEKYLKQQLQDEEDEALTRQAVFAAERKSNKVTDDTAASIAHTEGLAKSRANAVELDAEVSAEQVKKDLASIGSRKANKDLSAASKEVEEANTASLPTKRTYKIQKGDTLSAIAARNKTTVAELARRNNIKDVNKIMAGASLDLGDGEPVKASTVPSKPAAKPTPKPKSKTQPKKPVSTPTAMPSILDMPDDKVESMPIPKATPQPKPTPAPAKPKQKETWGAYKLRQLTGSAPPKGVEPYK